MKLENLPSEILALILDGKTSSSVLAIWLCGSRRLMVSMARSITLLRLSVHANSQMALMSLPSCISSFSNLRHFSAHFSSVSSCRADDIHHRLRLLPKGLQSLALSGLGVAHAMFPVSLKDDFQWSDYRIGGNAAQYLDLTRMWYWNESFPNMESLEIKDRGARQSSWQIPIYLGDYIFPYLPRSLITLILNTGTGRFTQMEHLPPSLQKLSLPLESLNHSALRSLPPSITDIDYSMTRDTFDLFFTEPQLFPNLKTLIPITTHALQEYASLIPTSQYPHYINNISSALETSALLPLLPSHLTSLTLEGFESEHALTSHLLLQLPPTLRTLIANAVQWMPITSKMWPSNLTHLSLHNGGNFGAHCFSRLPRSLKKLTTRDITAFIDEERATFEISDLQALGRASLQDDEKESWSALKDELIERRDRLKNVLRRQAIDQYIETVSQGGLYGLPLGLTELSLCDPMENFLLLLPPQLTSLHTRNILFSESFDFWNLLPTYSLTDITLESDALAMIPCDPLKWLPKVVFAPHGLPSSELKEVSPVSPPTIDPALTALYHNHCLLNLQLTLKSVTPEAVGAFIKFLPRNLSSLSLDMEFVNGNLDSTVTIWISEEDLTQLPPRLQFLSFSAVNRLHSSSWLKCLPHSILSLNLVGFTLVGSDLKNLPPNLERLTFSDGCNFLLDDILSMPNTLRTVSTSVDLTGGISHDLWKKLTSSFIPFRRIWDHPKDLILNILTQNV